MLLKLIILWKLAYYVLIHSPLRLARLLGGDIKPAKVDLKTTRPITITIAKFISFHYCRSSLNYYTIIQCHTNRTVNKGYIQYCME
jgi:hypothetical protein